MFKFLLIFILIINQNLIITSDWVEIRQDKSPNDKITSNIFENSDLLKRFGPGTQIGDFIETTKITKVPLNNYTNVKNFIDVLDNPKQVILKNVNSENQQPITTVQPNISIYKFNNISINRKGYSSKDEESQVVQNISSESDGDKIDDSDSSNDNIYATVEDENDDDFFNDIKTNHSNEDEEEEDNDEEQPTTNIQPQPYTFGIFDFVKQIQESFFKKTFDGIQDKIKILQQFSNELLQSIEYRLKSLWPSNVIRQRKKRGIMTSEGQMDFPSAEGALMTICFLTFAVFLIKLVLQVINTIKSKHYSYNGFDQSSMATVKLMKSNMKGRKLSFSSDESIRHLSRVVESIEKIKN